MKKNLLFTCLFIYCSITTSVSADITYTLDESYGQVPLTFVLNQGQFHPDFRFAAEGNGYGAFYAGNYPLTVYNLTLDSKIPLEKVSKPTNENYHLICLNFFEANKEPEITGEDPVSWCSNFFIGNDPEKWITDIPHYKAIRFHNLYEGIDLVYRSEGRSIIYELIIHPGADPAQLAFQNKISEQTTLNINENGELVFFVRDGDFTGTTVQAAPGGYQNINGEIISVPLRYRFIDKENRIVTFDYGEYDTNYALIIKPPMVYCPQFGIKETTEVNCIDVDEEGNAYVAGKAHFLPLANENAGNFDSDRGVIVLFSLKLNETGDELGYVTYFGGSGKYFTEITDSYVTSENEFCIVGWTQEQNYPLTSNAPDPVSIHNEGIITLFSQNGNNILFSSYWGGSWIEYIRSVCIVDKKIFVTGYTKSDDFYLTEDAIDKSYDEWNGFLSILSYETNFIIYSSYLWKSSPQKIIVDPSGIYISGIVTTNDYTISGNTQIPNYQGGLSDVFVVKLLPDASDYIFINLIGGSDEETISDMNIDISGNVILIGETDSLNFPLTKILINSTLTNKKNSYITKMHGDGSNIIYSSIFAFNKDNESSNVKINNSMNSIVIGNINDNLYIAEVNNAGDNLLTLTVFDEGPVVDADILKIEKDSEFFMIGYSSQNIGSPFDTSYSIFKVRKKISTFVKNEFKKVPQEFIVFPSYPNPCNHQVIISFYQPKKAITSVKIYNIIGQLVDDLLSAELERGTHSIQWNSEYNNSGVYIICIETLNEIKSIKLTVIK